jgi:hypothetical protein
MKLRKQALMFFFLTLIILNNVKSQGYYKGFYTGSYKEAKGDDDLSNTKKEFCIIYNENSCLLKINGVVTLFKINSYARKLTNNNIQESFTNLETDNYPEGWFDININNRQAKSNEITINIPKIKGGYFYYIEDALDISLDSINKNKSLIAKWKNFQHNVYNAEPDTLTKEEIEKINEKDSLIALVIDSIYSMGDNYNQQQIKWLDELIASVVKVKNGESFYKDFKILIDANGYITQIYPVDRNDMLAKKYQNKISNAVVGIKLIPFKGTNGKYYPSYKTLYITLLPE